MKKSGVDFLVRIGFLGLIIIFISTIMTEAAVAADSGEEGWWDKYDGSGTNITSGSDDNSTNTGGTGEGEWVNYGGTLIWVPEQSGDTADSGTTNPGTTNPGTGEGQWIWGVWVPANGSNTTDPGTTDSGTTNPGTTDPGTTDPGTTDPGDDPEDSRFDDDGDGYSENQGDCNDSDPSIYPGATEVCGDGIDQDCSGADEVCGSGDPNDIDNDGDGYSENQGDCDDNDNNFFPKLWYLDADNDGYPYSVTQKPVFSPSPINAINAHITACTRPSGGYKLVSELSATILDCNDEDASIHPFAAEVCGDGKDNDCDEEVDETCASDPIDIDDDGDGYTENEGDCDDSDSTIFTGATEICNDNIDNNCDGEVDEACVTNTPPDAPLALSPNANINTSLTPELIVYEFVDVDGDSHQKTRWQIRLDQNIVIDEITDQQLLSWQVPSECILEMNTQYSWQAMFFDGQDWSVPSNMNEFFTGSSGTEFDDNGIGKESVIGPEEEVKLGDSFIDANGNLITSDTVKAFKSIANPDVQIGMIVNSDCTIEKICSRRSEDVVAEDTSFNGEIPEMPYGMIDFELIVPEKGADINVTIYFSEPLSENFIWWKYDPKIGFYDYAASAYPATVLYISSDRKSITLEFKDGGYGDLIEEPDGKIIDPGGVGVAMNATSSSSGGGGGGSCFINSLFF